VNLPNSLTVARIVVAPVLAVLPLMPSASVRLGAFLLFLAAAITDYYDGKLARARGLVTDFGKVMDPLADKLLVTAALVSLVSLDRVQAWVAMVIIAREFAVTGLRQMAIEQGHVMAAGGWGKLKTVLQIAMVLALIAVDGSPAWVDALVYVTVAVTVASGADYFFGLRRITQARPSSHSRIET
jgi:CDP-diacylglycerol--glycerol-3-phosphate 3-phosphatidyltransferase